MFRSVSWSCGRRRKSGIQCGCISAIISTATQNQGVFETFEILVRMVAEGSLRRFFRQGWNVFDFVIVTASLIPVEESQMALLGRLLRIFRVLRLVSISST